ncbi:hypothetical protein KTC91_27890, partial [Klebsiella pneumoniae]|nr:hypothetical protein [Klebsiella pneumoniae]
MNITLGDQININLSSSEGSLSKIQNGKSELITLNVVRSKIRFLLLGFLKIFLAGCIRLLYIFMIELWSIK